MTAAKKKILSFYINHRGKFKFFLHSRFLLFTFYNSSGGADDDDAAAAAAESIQ